MLYVYTIKFFLILLLSTAQLCLAAAQQPFINSKLFDGIPFGKELLITSASTGRIIRLKTINDQDPIDKECLFAQDKKTSEQLKNLYDTDEDSDIELCVLKRTDGKTRFKRSRKKNSGSLLQLKQEKKKRYEKGLPVPVEKSFLISTRLMLEKDILFLSSLNDPAVFNKWKNSETNLTKIMQIIDKKIERYADMLIDPQYYPLWNYITRVSNVLMTKASELTDEPKAPSPRPVLTSLSSRAKKMPPIHEQLLHNEENDFSNMPN
jgi:hypothetical protein